MGKISPTKSQVSAAPLCMTESLGDSCLAGSRPWKRSRGDIVGTFVGHCGSHFLVPLCPFNLVFHTACFHSSCLTDLPRHPGDSALSTPLLVTGFVLTCLVVVCPFGLASLPCPCASGIAPWHGGGKIYLLLIFPAVHGHVYRCRSSHNYG